MGLRPEHLEGIIRRIDNIERMVKALVLKELINMAKGEAKDILGAITRVLKLEQMANDIFFDRGEWTKEDLTQLVNEIFKDAEGPVKQRVQEYIAFVL